MVKDLKKTFSMHQMHKAARATRIEFKELSDYNTQNEHSQAVKSSPFFV
jgi:hypothetical protein